LEGTTKQFEMAYSVAFNCRLYDSIGLGDPKVQIPVWLSSFNALIKQGIKFRSIIIVLEHKLRPDIIDEQFMAIVDEALGKANAGPGAKKLDPRRLLIVWNKAEDGYTPGQLEEYVRDYYKYCLEVFNLKNFPTEHDLFQNKQFLVIPKMNMGLGPRDRLEDHPEKANKLVHAIYNLLLTKMQDYHKLDELCGRIQLGQISHEDVLKRTRPEAAKLL
jgi:hypothetical protein